MIDTSCAPHSSLLVGKLAVDVLRSAAWNGVMVASVQQPEYRAEWNARP